MTCCEKNGQMNTFHRRERLSSSDFVMLQHIHIYELENTDQTVLALMEFAYEVCL
jgi:hypothetical protein